MVRIQDASYIRTMHFFVRLIFEPILYSGASYKSKCIFHFAKRNFLWCHNVDFQQKQGLFCHHALIIDFVNLPQQQHLCWSDLLLITALVIRFLCLFFRLSNLFLSQIKMRLIFGCVLQLRAFFVISQIRHCVLYSNQSYIRTITVVKSELAGWDGSLVALSVDLRFAL